ncbi:FAD-dependent oxidoreductase [Microbulbifer sp. VAAF005]|uniref:dihydrolipoyl dehydrogenase family protein n=1 Tax=Microbulbifer sp. VAAF005 TaxID=3034230 RepID=UPI0024AD95BC|nr:FAD-dependent oxidoreductase [Microbulbifer sp. VAAF005]WHI48209.1 FAD-dependent oxidoreductase [Microbulbifer sp. VAAF005]
MQKPKKFDRNLIVIGGGAAGLVTAYISAAVKAKVTLIEAGKMGGDCLNTGCVPSKALIMCARQAHRARCASEFGVILQEPVIDFPRVMQHVRESIQAIEPNDSVERYTELGVEVLQGTAELVDPWTVKTCLNGGGEQILTARAIVLATGAEPSAPPFPGLDQVNYLTSDTLWDRFTQLQAPPRRLVLLGGGAIGCELAQALVRLGSQVVLVERSDTILPELDTEVSAAVTEALTRDGVEILTDHEAVEFEGSPERNGGTLIVQNKGNKVRLEFDEVILALGRKAKLAGLGLENLGLQESGRLQLDGYLRTTYPHILAAGDVAGPYQFTHMASHQAWYAAVNALFGDLKKFAVDYSLVPSSVFVDPEVASVGLSEEAARKQNVNYEITRYDLEHLDRAIVDGARRGFVKVLTVPGKDKILGVSIVGENAAELIAEFILAMKYGLGLNKILSTIHIYPTMSEANKFVAGNWKRAHAPTAILRFLEVFNRWRRN